MPSSQVTALVNGGRLNVMGSPVRRTELPLTRFYSDAGAPCLAPFARRGDFAIIRRLALWHGHYRQTAMPGAVGRPYREDDIILRKLQRGPRGIANILRV